MRWSKVFLLVAAIAAFVGAVLVVRELRKPPAPSPAASGSSITDVARNAPGTIAGPIAPSVAPPGRELLPPPVVVPPSAMPDPANPPRWTEPLAVPGAPQPPDPFTPPPMVVDPNRGRVPADDAGP